MILVIFMLLAVHNSFATAFFRHRHHFHVRGFGECYMPNNRVGTCVPLRECPSLHALASKRRVTLADRIYLRRSRCGHIGRSPLVCCSQSNVKGKGRADGSPILANDLPQPGECGTVQVDSSARINYLVVGGKPTKIYDSPWLALLQYEKPSGSGFLCGAALINKDYVVTAAHCTSDGILKKSNLTLISVRLGEWDIDEENDCENEICSDPVVDIGIKEIIPHEHYHPNAKNHQHDIALIRLARSVSYTKWIKPICLPTKENFQNRIYDDVAMKVSGWGHTSSFGSAKGSSVKMQVTLRGFSTEQCNKGYARLNVILNSTQMCAGGRQGFDSCRGDSGSPLVKYEGSASPAHWYIVGIVSFGSQFCGSENLPGVYTRIDKYVDWILDNMKYFK